MSTTFLIVAVLAAQAELERVREALATGDYYSAWEALAREPDELARSRIRAEILYRAGDPAGALRAARAGLDIDAAQIELLYHATGAAIWLEDSADAVEYSVRLVEEAEALVERGPEEKRAWREAAGSLAARSDALVARQEALRRALMRLRLAAVGGVTSWLVALGFVLRSQGRSSKPVS